MAFYATHNIGWVARPPHDTSSPDGFKRAGRFKKASNMNYALTLSLKVERHLERLLTGEKEKEKEGERDSEVDASLEEKALAFAIEEAWAESGRRWRPWAGNGKACRMGELILLVDSDTLVPEVSLMCSVIAEGWSLGCRTA